MVTAGVLTKSVMVTADVFTKSGMVTASVLTKGYGDCWCFDKKLLLW